MRLNGKMNLRKTYLKIIVREIKESFGRFAAIIAIVALGVGFLVGIMSATPAMKFSVDKYYDENNMTDIFIKSAIGFSDEDINLIRSLPETKYMKPAFVTDAVVSTGSNETIVARIVGIPLESSNDAGFVNKLTLIDGRMPKNDGECVVLRPGSSMSDLPAGTVLTISAENENADYIYKIKEYTVVGTVGSPFYFSGETEKSTVGSGKVGAVIYTNESSYALEEYTDIYLTVKGAEALDSFGDEYEKVIESAVTKIESSGLDMTGRYVLDRGANVTYVSYKINVQKVSDIARVFPLFFFFVAALVTLTTMTRMVEEERTQIGTLKALGYSRSAIMVKYLLYCTLASVIGSGLGLAVGVRLLPVVINNAYASIYQLPPFYPQFNAAFAIIVCAIEIFCTVGVTYSACRHSLKEKPAFLMLPKVPQAGKRIFLERIKPIWSRLSFSYKATARNIFRYKKHLLMTVTGIAGCTALILTGFGLKDSMNDIANTQYNKIFLFDMKIGLKDAELNEDLANFLNDKIYMPVYSQQATLKSDKDEVEAVVYVPDDSLRFGNYIYLHNRKTGRDITPSDSKVVITEKMADALGITTDDMFTLTNEDGVSALFKVTAITENYVGSYAYIDTDVYSSAYGETVNNTLLVKTNIKDIAEQDKITAEILSAKSAEGVEFNAQAKKSYDNLLASLNYIIMMLIAAAGILAVVVLYNLTNININERIKELATLRVLGYHHTEVATYILREITILTGLGILAGLGLGVLLLRFIIVSAESVDLMFGRTITSLSFFLSAFATLAFSLIVDLMMAKKLRKIRMTESMKAID